VTAEKKQEAQGPRGLAHGQLAYVQIPAVEPLQSAAFYEAGFGWRIERPYPGFEAPELIGLWVDDRPSAQDAGLTIWIHVDDIGRALELVRVHGGAVLEPPSSDGPTRTLAAIRDPGGNRIRLVHHSPES
jgi:predicted enzyme related to lactoylglutathione lyase